jgi:hypothetical protein
MSEHHSSREMINVELAARAKNKKSLKTLKHMTPVSEQDALKIMFNCECSDPYCRDRVAMTLLEYERLHTTIARFVIKKGHLEPSVEAVQASNKTISVVDKYAL